MVGLDGMGWDPCVLIKKEQKGMTMNSGKWKERWMDSSRSTVWRSELIAKGKLMAEEWGGSAALKSERVRKQDGSNITSWLQYWPMVGFLAAF